MVRRFCLEVPLESLAADPRSWAIALGLELHEATLPPGEIVSAGGDMVVLYARLDPVRETLALSYAVATFLLEHRQDGPFSVADVWLLAFDLLRAPERRHLDEAAPAPPSSG